jgi:NTP pyrophosphatase (non-canonical NTP hydrolase)
VGLHLTFAQVSDVNRQRCTRWHGGFPREDEWTGADWSNAMCGEAGEAANVVKKLRRLETGIAGADDPPREELLAMLADEIADTYAYLDLLATYYDINLADAVVSKFNRVSAKQGFPERLPTKRVNVTPWSEIKHKSAGTDA